jgi:hypothetical protein
MIDTETIQKLEGIAELLLFDVTDYGKDYEELDELYDGMLNECSTPIAVGCIQIDPAKALKEQDPTAYRCGKVDWVDGETTEGQLVEVSDRYLTPDEVDTLATDLGEAVAELV